MAEETKIDETKEVTDETTKEVVDDKKGEIKEEEDKGKEEEEEFDESEIDPEVRDYKPPEVKKEKVEDEEEDEEVDPEDEARIEKIIEKKYGGDLQQVKKQVAIDSYFSNHPEEVKYKGAVMKYLNHPTYTGLPIHNIVAIVSAKDQQRIGAAKEREAQRVVAETKSPGGTFRKTTGETTDWLNVPKAEYEAQKAKILGYP